MAEILGELDVTYVNDDLDDLHVGAFVVVVELFGYIEAVASAGRPR